MIGPVGSIQKLDWVGRPRSGPSREDVRSTSMVATLAAAPGWGGAQLAEAPFLVQLIAGRDGLPQARARRRAEPADGARLYRDTAERLGSGQQGTPHVARFA